MITVAVTSIVPVPIAESRTLLHMSLENKQDGGGERWSGLVSGTLNFVIIFMFESRHLSCT